MHAWLIGHRRPVVAAAMALWAVGVVGFLALVVDHGLELTGPVGVLWLLAYASFAITGAFITWQRPDHVLGPLFLTIGLVPTLANVLSAAALGQFADRSMLLATLVAAMGVSLGTATYTLLMVVIVTFPDGRLPSPRWRWIWVACVATSVVGAATAFLTGAWGGDRAQTIIGPPIDGRAATIGAALSPLYHGMVVGLKVAGLVAVVLRYRRSDATIRTQIRWLVLAVLLLVVFFAAVVVGEIVLQRPASGAEIVAFTAGISLIPVSVTIAILRHQLFDIDVVLNRTIVFGLLAAFITSLYVVIVVGVGTLVGDPSNLALTVGATAVVAAGFEPARARVQHWANIAVFGRRASPYEVLATIADELTSSSVGDSQLEGMAALLADGTGARHATVWVAVDDRLRAAACSPSHDPAEHDPIPVVDAVAPPVEGSARLEPVNQDGELIGALSVQRRRDELLTPREHRLVAELAGQASLVLGYARLQGRLEVRLDELRASRQRLVATQNEARRRLERNLHDGAQQQLVALKVKLGLARTIAGREDADQVLAERLASLSATADRAVDSLRTIARGIYPPLLEAEGLTRAIAAHVSSAPIHVSVRTDGVGRYSRQVEATVYFCLIEALGNTVRHADASTLEIVLVGSVDQLAFTLVDDGSGFDPHTTSQGLGLRNMADRVDALGGSLTVESAPGAGVRVHGSIPVTQSAPVAAVATAT